MHTDQVDNMWHYTPHKLGNGLSTFEDKIYAYELPANDKLEKIRNDVLKELDMIDEKKHK